MTTPELTEKQRTDILSRVRAGYAPIVAAIDVGVDPVVALRDPDLTRDTAFAEAVGTERMAAKALEFALSDGNAGVLLRLLEKREAASKAALAQMQQEQGSALGDWLTRLGLAPPSDKPAVEWFVDLLIRARKLLEEERLLGEAEPSTMAVRRAHEILEAAGYVIARVEIDRTEKQLPPEAPQPALPQPRPSIPDHRDPNHSLASALRTGRATLIGRSSQ